jgi:FtsP/CotA-like multicopper oxidase with cupredoxin domain
MKKTLFLMLMGLALAVVALPLGIDRAYGNGGPVTDLNISPNPIPTYFANSPLGVIPPDTAFGVGNDTGTPLAKFVQPLPSFPLAVVKTNPSFPTDDYYELGVVDYTWQFHPALPPSKVRGYVDLNTGTPTPSYLGPLIVAQRDRPVRILFKNQLSLANLFLPVDTTIMGAGKSPVDGLLYSENRVNIHLHGGNTPWISDGTPHQWWTPAGTTLNVNRGWSFKSVPDMPAPAAGENTLYYTNQQSGRLMFYHDHVYGMTRLNVYAGEAAGYLLTDPIEQALVASQVIPSNAYQVALVIQDKTFVPQDIAIEDPSWDITKWGDYGSLWFPHIYEPNQTGSQTGAGASPVGRWDYGPWFWPIFPAQNLPDTTTANPTAYKTSIVPEAFMDTMVVNGKAYPFYEVEKRRYRFRILNACNDRNLNLQLYVADADPAAGGTVATATASISGGAVNGIAVTNPGSGYTSVPGVHISGGGGFGATAVATLTGGGSVAITLTYGGSGYTGAPTVTIGGGTEVKMVPAIQTMGFPASWPTDGRDGGVPDPANVGPTMIQIGNEGGLLPAPTVLPNQPVNYVYNRRDIIVLSVSDKTLFMGPAERADVIVDFSAYPVGTKIILYNDAPAPVPAFDPRFDYYTGNPDQTASGGAPPTRAGFGPNTRTIMQFQVKAATGAADPYNYTTCLAALQAPTTGLPNAFAKSQPPPIVPQAAYGPAYGQTFTDTYSTIQANSLTFTPVGGLSPKTVNYNPKAIQELFDPYGRMNATLGVELPFTTANIQTTLPFQYIDPVTEIIPFGGTQLWKITHNGVDTHSIHFHLFNVQVINRVGWDGAIRPPDANELGWKETVRMNPLEDIIVALNPTRPNLPFGLPDSIRPLDTTSALGSTGQFSPFDPLNKPVTTVNTLYNFGWEYVWHCHLLGHEENDMMRPIKMTGTSIPEVTDYLLLQ